MSRWKLTNNHINKTNNKLLRITRITIIIIIMIIILIIMSDKIMDWNFFAGASHPTRESAPSLLVLFRREAFVKNDT